MYPFSFKNSKVSFRFLPPVHTYPMKTVTKNEKCRWPKCPRWLTTLNAFPRSPLFLLAVKTSPTFTSKRKSDSIGRYTLYSLTSRTSSRTSCVDIMIRKDNDGQVVIRVHVQHLFEVAVPIDSNR